MAGDPNVLAMHALQGTEREPAATLPGARSVADKWGGVVVGARAAGHGTGVLALGVFVASRGQCV